jgi:hypothetical protein
MASIRRSVTATLVLSAFLTLAATSARADLYTLAASGTIGVNTTGDSKIPVGTPWSFEITYDTASPDQDSAFGGTPDPTFGVFANTGAPPALTFFHYRAGTYEAALHAPADFGSFSSIHTTFTSINAIDINIFASTFFPTLAGGAVTFHADFNRFVSPPVFSSDALPTNTAITAASFDPSTVSLLPPAGEVSSSNITALSITPGLSGDFNANGTVDAADYAYWRKNFSTDPSKFYAWRANFGATLTSGSGTAPPSLNLIPTTVPEPGMLPLLLSAPLYAAPRRTRRSQSRLHK